MTNLITLTDPNSSVSEAYRTLRTNLSFYSLDNPIQTLVVTSPTAVEDSSLTIANLAVTMAQSGRKTVLVDCDLRRPSLHTLFDLPAQPGITDAVLQEMKSLPLQKTKVDNLWLLASGTQPPNPADFVGTRKIDDLIAQLKNEAEVILFDTPPVVAVTDAAILGAKVDGVLLVIQAGATKREQAERAQELLNKASINLVGVTLTHAPKTNTVNY